MQWSPTVKLLIQEEDNKEDLSIVVANIPDSISERTCSGSSVVHLCALNDKPNSLCFLLEQGCSVNAKNDYDEVPLHWAGKSGAIKTCKILITCGADINALDSEGNTPLHWACESGNTEMVKILLNCKRIGTEIENMEGYTPLEVAVMNGDLDSVKVFLKKGLYDFDRKQTLLKCAFFTEDREMINIISEL